MALAGEGWRRWVVVAAVVAAAVMVDLWTTPGRRAARGGVLASMRVAVIAVNGVGETGGGLPSAGGSTREITGEARGAVAPFL